MHKRKKLSSVQKICHALHDAVIRELEAALDGKQSVLDAYFRAVILAADAIDAIAGLPVSVLADSRRAREVDACVSAVGEALREIKGSDLHGRFEDLRNVIATLRRLVGLAFAAKWEIELTHGPERDNRMVVIQHAMEAYMPILRDMLSSSVGGVWFHRKLGRVLLEGVAAARLRGEPPRQPLYTDFMLYKDLDTWPPNAKSPSAPHILLLLLDMQKRIKVTSQKYLDRSAIGREQELLSDLDEQLNFEREIGRLQGFVRLPGFGEFEPIRQSVSKDNQAVIPALRLAMSLIADREIENWRTALGAHAGVHALTGLCRFIDEWMTTVEHYLKVARRAFRAASAHFAAALRQPFSKLIKAVRSMLRRWQTEFDATRAYLVRRGIDV